MDSCRQVRLKEASYLYIKGESYSDVPAKALVAPEQDVNCCFEMLPWSYSPRFYFSLTHSCVFVLFCCVEFCCLIGLYRLDFQLLHCPLKSQKLPLKGPMSISEHYWSMRCQYPSIFFPATQAVKEGKTLSLSREDLNQRDRLKSWGGAGTCEAEVAACSAMLGPITRAKRIKSQRIRKQNMPHENALYFPPFPFISRQTKLY